MKTLILTTAALVAVAAAGAATASPDLRPRVPTLTILHLDAGCHAWSLNGDRYRLEQTVRLREGQSLQVVNFDRRVQRLVQLSGGALTLDSAPSPVRQNPQAHAMPLPPEPGVPAAETGTGVMGYWGAAITATFQEPGSYILTTIEGDAFAGADAAFSGQANTLSLRVLVFPQLHHPLP